VLDYFNHWRVKCQAVERNIFFHFEPEAHLLFAHFINEQIPREKVS